MGKEEITQPKMYREERKAQVNVLKNNTFMSSKWRKQNRQKD